MCIICCKKKGIAMPTDEMIEQMWDANRDGAGIAWSENNIVHIEKGFMTLEDIKKHLRTLSGHVDMTAIPMLMHFRIATHGGISPQNTHPFPVVGKYRHMKKLSYTTDLAVVHNGIIPIKADNGVSDTMTYINKRLSKIKASNPEFYTSKKTMKRIEREISSKMAFLTDDGEIYTIGNFIEEDGLLFSNGSYKKTTYDFYDMKLLCPIYGYISSKGRLTDAAEEMFYMDKYDNVYEYSYLSDAAVRIDAIAYTYEGLLFRFDEDEAFYMYTEGDFYNDFAYKRNR